MPRPGQAGEALSLGAPVTLVLAEDGTAVETEGFFGALAPHTPLVALGPGQHWEPPKVGPQTTPPNILVPPRPRPITHLGLNCQAGLYRERWEPEPPRARGSPAGDEVARVTVALAKASPNDLVGQLRVTAAVRGLRCDVGGLGPERLLR